ncbi:hypothetical protein D9758_012322 [Tetrapyrgos nigripes]|uniref:Heterokaryon incompatibility domain-containing protein n=1 Tax=Tetrapyrgos nigripes TaxID=182062 RepID=A0A8H5CLY9_9AGAR|nr:hypothetical protein D9758_012322 [Tetrapyrgos nigripes]
MNATNSASGAEPLNSEPHYIPFPLTTRICPSCSSMKLSGIQVGKVFFFTFSAEDSLDPRSRCNLCQLFQALYTAHIENDYRHTVDPPDSKARKTTRSHLIRVEIMSITSRQMGQIVDIFVEDTWYANGMKRQLCFRDPYHSPSKSSMKKRDPEREAYDADHGLLSAQWADLALAKTWIRECIQDHTDCGSLVSSEPTSGLHPSTRFIDVRLWRLVKLEEIILRSPIQYIALSYVWGREYQLKTTMETLKAFSRRLPRSIAGEDGSRRLPRTIYDAMVVTRALGYRFLWVDALCIIQDSSADLGIQLAQMDVIYGLAIITIVARGSASSDSGLHGVSSPRNRINQSDTEVMINRGLELSLWNVLGEDEEYQETRGELADRRFYIWRGWTFQEQILSTRNLEFNPTRMLFRCGRDYSQQETGYPAVASRDMRDPNHFRHAIRQFQRFRANPELKVGLASHQIMTKDMLAARWDTIRENYSTRSFTSSADRRNAILGTAKVLHDVIGDVDSGGHMRSRLHGELLWYLNTEPSGNPPPLMTFPRDPAPEGILPSWSWLNLWPLSWPAMIQPLHETIIRFASDAEFGKDTRLEIEGVVLDMKLRSVNEDDTERMNLLAYLDGTVSNLTLRMDSPDLKEDTVVTCIPMAKAIFNGYGGKRDYWYFKLTPVTATSEWVLRLSQNMLLMTLTAGSNQKDKRK